MSIIHVMQRIYDKHFKLAAFAQQTCFWHNIRQNNKCKQLVRRIEFWNDRN